MGEEEVRSGWITTAGGEGSQEVYSARGKNLVDPVVPGIRVEWQLGVDEGDG